MRACVIRKMHVCACGIVDRDSGVPVFVIRTCGCTQGLGESGCTLENQCTMLAGHGSCGKAQHASMAHPLPLTAITNTCAPQCTLSPPQCTLSLVCERCTVCTGTQRATHLCALIS